LPASKTITVGCRGTDFCRAQTGKVLEKLAVAVPAAKFEIEEIAESARPGALLEALATGRIDLHVRGARELPVILPEGIRLAACTERNDPFDVLLSQGGQLLEDLNEGATVAAESARVAVQLGRFREDIKMRKIDGTVDRLLPLLERGEVEGIVVAAEDVETLGWEGLVTEAFPPDILLPAAGQGSFAILTHEGDERTAQVAAALDHELTRQIVLAERAFLRELHVDTGDPVAVHGRLEDGVILLEGMLGDAVSGAVLRDELDGDPSEGEDLGVRLAKLFMADGAVDYLASYK
jgi:hydroxymethylbilane synthase